MRKITEVYRHIGKDNVKAEYRFENNVCIGFFLDDKKEEETSNEFKNYKLDYDFEKGLKDAEFEHYHYEVEI